MRQFTFLFIGLGLLFLFLIPPFQKPDEIVQYHKTIALASGSFRCVLQNNQPVHSMPAYLANLPQTLFSDSLAHNPQVKIAKTEYLKLIRQTQFDRSLVSEPTSCPLNPIFYSVPAIVLFFPVTFGFHPLLIFFMGRVVMFAMCGVICVQAVRFLQKGQRKLLYVLLFLPMTLQQLTAYNKDALHLAFGALFFALFIKLHDAHQKHYFSKYILFCVVGLVMVLTRVQYFAFLFLLFEPLAHLNFSKKQLKNVSPKKLAIFVGFIFLFGSIFLFSLRTYSKNFFTLSFDSYVKNVYPAYQLQNITMDPLLFTQRLFDTFNSNFDFYLKSGIGMLGWLDTVLPHWTYVFYVGVFFYVVFTLPKEHFLRKREAALIGFISLITVFTIFLSFYLFWTPVGAGIVEGVQGRYFIVLVPFLAIALASIFSVLGNKKLIVLAGLVSVITGYTLFNRYYNSGRYYYVDSTASQIQNGVMSVQPDKKLVGLVFEIGRYHGDFKPSILEVRDARCDEILVKKVIDIGQVKYEKEYQILFDRKILSELSNICVHLYPMDGTQSIYQTPTAYPVYLY